MHYDHSHAILNQDDEDGDDNEKDALGEEDWKDDSLLEEDEDEDKPDEV